jgi:hypothetical protein
VSKKKSICVTILGVLMLSAFASSAAVAAEAGWMVEGKNLAAGAAENFSEATTRVGSNYKLAGGGVEVECEAMKLVGGFITGPKKGGVKSLHLTGCKTSASKCTFEPTTLSTVPVLAEATLDPPNALAAVAVLKPETGTVFATFKFEGESCALAGTKAITGTQALLAPTGTDEAKEHIFTFIELSAGELKLGGPAAKVTGSAGITLESGKTGSFL